MSDVETPNLDDEAVTIPEEGQDHVDLDETEAASQETGSVESDAESDQEQQLSLEDIASVTGLELDDLDVNEAGQVVMKTKVDGQEGVVTFADSRRNYQIQSNLDKKGMEANQLKEQLKAQLDEQNQAYQERLNNLDDLAQIAYLDLQNEYQNVNWDELKELDQAAYVARRQDFQDRKAALDSRYQEIQKQRNDFLTKEQQKHIEQAEADLVKAFPQWENVEVGKKEIAELRAYGETLGFTPEEMAGTIRAPAFSVLKKAKAYDDLQKSQPETKKRVKRAPKVSKPGNEAPKKLLTLEDKFYGT